MNKNHGFQSLREIELRRTLIFIIQFFQRNANIIWYLHFATFAVNCRYSSLRLLVFSWILRFFTISILIPGCGCAGGRARPKTYLRLKYVVDGLIRQMPDLLEQFGMILLQPAYVGGTKWTQADTGSTDAAYCR